MEIKLSYTSSEAFQMAKDMFPLTWKQEIDKHKAILLGLKRTYGQDLIKSYQRYLNAGCRQESAIMMLASLYWIREEEKNYKQDVAQQIHDLEAQQLQYSKQYEANEKAINIQELDKRALRGFYKGKQDELQARINQLLATIEVVNPVILNIQTQLFARSQS